MEFKNITFEDRELFKGFDYLCSDYSFSYLYMYAEAYKLRLYHDDNSIVIRSGVCHPVFYMPLGDTSKGIETVLKYCSQKKIKPVFLKIPENYIHFFTDHNLIPDEDRDSFDYIYKTSDLVEYEGSEYRKQRNNISNYLRTFTPHYTSDVSSHIEDCKNFTIEYYGSKKDILNPTFRILEKFNELNLKGGIVWDNERIKAFCIYEKISSDTVMSHVELNDNSHRGIHAYMISEMSKSIDEKYINKEDDMGLVGLRRFKESYHPSCMLKKYKAVQAI